MKFLIVVFGCCAIAFSQTDTMFVETDAGVLRYPVSVIRDVSFSGTNDVREQEAIARALSSFALHQNYPNPFNPSTRIEYEIPRAGFVHIQIVDITGKVVDEREGEWREAGLNSATWDGRGSSGYALATGVYFCRVKFENSILTQKLLMLK